MNIKQQQIGKGIALLTAVFAATLFLFTSCANDDDVYVAPHVTIAEGGEIPERNEVSFSQEATSKTIDITTNREWKITKDDDADWIDISTTEGSEGTSSVTITVKSNEAPSPRKGYFTIKASTAVIKVRVNQASADGVGFEYYTIEDIRTKYAESGSDTWTITEPWLLEAVVISDRESGNSTSLKNGFIQDENGHGLAFRVTETIHEFDLGDEISLDLQGGVVSQYGGAVQLAFSTSKAIVQATGVSVAPQPLTIEEIKSGYYDGTLVKVTNVQFREYIGLTYFEGDFSAHSRTIENEDGATMDVRTARYADFSDEPLPKGSGNLTGILSVFNNNWQLNIRNLGDVEMSDDASTRYVIEGPGDEILNEPFAAKIGSFTEYRVLGEADWFGHTYGGDEYVRVTGYQKGANENWLISPAMDLSEVSSARLTFSHAVAHWTGNEKEDLTVWISSKYKEGNPTEVEWEQITINLPADGSYYVWEDVSVVLPSSMMGKKSVHLAFRYTNEDGKACTWQVHKVVVN